MYEEEKYIAFASEESNIILGKCDQNALNFQRKFGGKIYIGSAIYVDENNLHQRRTVHIWNEIAGNLIDIYCYKREKKGFYCDHQPEAEITEETLKMNNPKLV